MQKNRDKQEFNDVAAITAALKKKIEEDQSLTARFNRATLNGLVLTVMHDPGYANEIYKQENWQEAVQNTSFAILCDIIAQFHVDWPEPEKPEEPANNGDLARIVYARQFKEYKRQKNLYDKQRPDALRWFAQEAVKSYPGRKETMVGQNDIRDSLPDPVKMTEWPEYVVALRWYLSSEPPEGENKPRSVQDLKGKSLHDIREAYDETFPDHITDAHLQKCDSAFINKLIDNNTTFMARHPDKENVATHAEIVATGTCKDGEGWTLRRLNTQEAAIAYGNPSGRLNGSSLCFTWDEGRDNAFGEFRHDLLMLCRDNGKSARFMHLDTQTYKNIDDVDVDEREIYEEFPGALEAILHLEAAKLTYYRENHEWEKFCSKLEKLSDTGGKELQALYVEQLKLGLEHFLRTNNYESCVMLLDAATDFSGPAIQKLGAGFLTRIFEQITRQAAFDDGEKLFRSASHNPEFKPFIEKALPELLDREMRSYNRDCFINLLLATNEMKAGQQAAKEAIEKLVNWIFEEKALNNWEEALEDIIVFMPASYSKPVLDNLGEIIKFCDKRQTAEFRRLVVNRENSIRELPARPSCPQPG